jgi:hypothetical protein
MWSSAKKEVKVEGFTFDLEAITYGGIPELRVFFDLDTWDTNTDGLIYTDKKFLSDVETNFIHMGLNIEDGDITYSEMGMQGANFVSFDLSDNFAARLLILARGLVLESQESKK